MLTGVIRGSFRFLWFGSLMVQIALVVAYVRFFHWTPETPEIPVPETLQQAVGATCRKVPEALPEPKVALRPVLVLPLAGDRESLVTETLRETLSRDGRYRAVEPALLDQIFQQMGMQRRPVSDPQQARELARQAQAEAVVTGQVNQMDIGEETATVAIHLRMLEVGSGKTLLSETFTNREPPEAAETWAVGNSQDRYYIAGVLVFALLWPLVLTPVMKQILKVEHNGLTLLALIVVIAVPVALACPWSFGGGASLWRYVGFAVGALLVGLWSIFVMSQVAEAME